MNSSSRKLAALLGTTLLLLCGSSCAPERSDDDDSACTEGSGTLRVCVTYSGAASEGSAEVRSDPSDELPLSALLEADGCVEIPLAAGDYEWRALHASDTCISSWEPTTISDCGLTDVQVELMDWCFDGR